MTKKLTEEETKRIRRHEIHKLRGRVQHGIAYQARLLYYENLTFAEEVDIKEGIQQFQYLFEEHVEDILEGKRPNVFECIPRSYYEEVKSKMPLDWLDRRSLDEFADWIRKDFF